uniref:U7 snRNA-associated Sm-like protein LSm10 isoform X2 n=1 Tax=Myxine glutinosa TaxID=7769 RepID=UPI00358F627C
MESSSERVCTLQHRSKYHWSPDAILVELRNESSVVGCVQNVDAFMNVRLNDAVFTDQCGRQEHVDQFFVAGRSVRYVHIPDDVNISRAIASQLEALRQFRKGMRSRGNRREFLNVRK